MFLPTAYPITFIPISMTPLPPILWTYVQVTVKPGHLFGSVVLLMSNGMSASLLEDAKGLYTDMYYSQHCVT